MCQYELMSAVNILAAAVAKDKTTDQLGLLAAAFTQLGDSLATIAVQKGLCQEKS